MKLFNETTDISEIWDESEGKEKEKKSSSIKRSKSRLAMMYENTFTNHPRLDSMRKNIFGSMKSKRKITPTPNEQTRRRGSTSSDNSGRKDSDDSDENCRKMNREMTSSGKSYLQRGMSDSRLNRENRRPNESLTDSSDLSCRTEFTIPGEFLFCSHVEHKSNFTSLYRKISSAGNLRRTMSTGALRKTDSTKTTDNDQGARRKFSSSETKKNEFRTPTRSSSCKTRSTFEMRTACEKIYPRRSLDIELQDCKKESSDQLAYELQSILDNNRTKGGNILSTIGNPRRPRRKSDRETNEIERDTSAINRDTSVIKRDTSVIKRGKGTSSAASKSRNMASRRSQSCKSVVKRNNNLFSIRNYLKDRNTQRSKSFATIREFSTHDAKHRVTDSRKSLSLTRDGRDMSHTQLSVNNHDNHERRVKTTRSFDINDTDAHGNSCLHHASSKGDISTIKYLLEQGGDVWVTNDDQRLPVDLATDFQTAKLLSAATLFYSEQHLQRTERNIIKTSKLNIAL